MEKLVSIITPCYNGESYISTFLNSILAQSYGNIELIIIDDGSTDQTAKIIHSFKTKFLEKKYTLKYIYQKNSGQAAALNLGLKIFTGDYFTWPDSDDNLPKNSIKTRVEYLESHQEHAFIRSDAAFYDEKNPMKPLFLATENIKNKYRTDLFDELILENDAYVCNGAYLVKTSSFLSINPNRHIFPSRAGQNWQLLIPMAFHFSCGYIDQVLYNITVRTQSHSRELTLYSEKIKRYEAHQEILLNIITNLDVNQEKYTNIITNKYFKKKFQLACESKIKKDIYFYFKKITKPSQSDIKLLIKTKFPFIQLLLNLKRG